MKKGLRTKRVLAFVSLLCMAMVVTLVVTNKVSSQAGEIVKSNQFEQEGARTKYTMNKKKFECYSWVAPIYGEKNIWGKRKVISGEEFKASDNDDAVFNFTVRGCKGADRARCYIMQLEIDEHNRIYLVNDRTFERDVVNGEDRNITVNFPQEKGKTYRYMFQVLDPWIDYYEYSPSIMNHKPIDLRDPDIHSVPRKEAFVIEAGTIIF